MTTQPANAAPNPAAQPPAKPQPDSHGVTWAPSRSGRLQIAVGPDAAARQRGDHHPAAWEVWAIFTGTHDLAPVTRKFTGVGAEADARAYANRLWDDLTTLQRQARTLRTR